MTARLLLPVVLATLFAVVGCSTPAPEEAPKPDDSPKAEANLPVAPAPRVKKSMAELLVGNWKVVQSDLRASGEFWREYTRDGKVIGRSRTRETGFTERECEYRLEGNQLDYIPSNTNNSPLRHETWESTAMIDSVTEEKLVIVVVIRKRYTLEHAKLLAVTRELPVELFLAEVWEERVRTIFERVKPK